MTCNSCGRTSMNENANFCDYCGTSFREAVYIESHQEKKENILKNEEELKDNKDISFLSWMGIMLLPVIPVIGPIVYFVMMLVWSFAKDINKTKKNWARASLIVGLVFIVIVIYWMVQSVLMLMNSGFDFNQYMNDINNMTNLY